MKNVNKRARKMARLADAGKITCKDYNRTVMNIAKKIRIEASWSA